MSRRVLVDTNVLLDVLGHREPHYAESAIIWSAADTGTVRGLVSATSITTVYYVLRRAADHRTAMRGVQLVRDVFEIVPVDRQIIDQAIDSPLGDFEDAIQYHGAVRAGAQVIVTRDVRHFRASRIPVLTPEAFLSHPEND